MLPTRSIIKALLSQRSARSVVALVYLAFGVVANGALAVPLQVDAASPIASNGVNEQEPVPKEPLPVEAEDPAAALRTLELYSKRVDELYGEFGAYDNQFSEALLNLGLAQQQLAQHDEAIQTLKQALHVNRINEGLYNPRVAPILERLIFSHASIGEWDAVDDRHHFLMQLSYQTLRPDDPALLPVLTKMSRWHLYAFIKNIDANPLKHLVAARGLFNRAASIIEVNFGSTDLRLAHQYRGRSIADYYLSLYQQHEHVGIGLSEEEEHHRKKVHIQNGFGEGLRAIKGSIAVYANNKDAPPEAHALALTQLGDWYLMFNKKQSASAAYSSAYAMLAADPAFEKVLKDTFGQPVALPDFNNAYFDYFDSEESQEMGYVLVTVDITENGTPRRAQIIDASEAKKSMRRRALMNLKSTVFRPRFEHGVAVATEGLRYRYRFELEPEKHAKKAKNHD